MSVFKRPENEGRFVVLDATLRLPKDWQPVLGYKALAERFAILKRWPASRRRLSLKPCVKSELPSYRIRLKLGAQGASSRIQSSRS